MNDGRISGQEAWASVLNHPVVDDVQKDRIPSATNGYGDWFGLGGYSPEVVNKDEDGPIIIDGMEVSTLAVVGNTVRSEQYHL